MIDTLGIFDILTKKEPISIIRYGDGEAGVLNGLCDPENYNRILRRQLGDGVSFQDAIKIRENLIEAFEGCDIVGMPYDKKGKGEYWDAAFDIYKQNIIAQHEHCHIDIHYHLLEHNLYDDLFKHFKKVNYISCRDVDFESKGLVSARFPIAPEAMFTTYKGKKHYPDQFIRIKDWIKSVTEPGDLCLVGAGIVGKIYCNWFRDCGGVAIDLGSIFDDWTGHVTRGKNRGRDVKKEPTWK